MLDITQVATAIRALLAEIETGEPPVPVRPGYVCIRPTGPQGAGKSRWWPEGWANLSDPRNGEMLLAYAQRMSRTIDADGHSFWSQGRWPVLPGFDPYQSKEGMSESLDRMVYPSDWATQAELDQQAANAAANAGAPWISNPPDGSVPIEGQ